MLINVNETPMIAIGVNQREVFRTTPLCFLSNAPKIADPNPTNIISDVQLETRSQKLYNLIVASP
jgi:hypothetical protein